MANAINNALPELTINSTTTINGVINDDSMATASATTAATSSSIKNYADNTFITSTVFWAYTAGTVNVQATTLYCSFTGSASSENNRNCVCPISGTMGNLYAAAVGAPGGGESFTYVVRKNNGDTIITCTISDSATDASDTTNTATVAAGDLITISITGSAASTNRAHRASFTISPTPVA